MLSKSDAGNFFEDFSVGQEIVHATPRTMSEGDVALYTALYGSRFAINSSDVFAMDIGYEVAPLDDFMVFHTVLGKSVPDISRNAIANLGYAGGRFDVPVIPGDTIYATSRIIGLKENSNGKSGVVYVHTTGTNQIEDVLLDYVRWVMVAKRDEAAPAPETVIPDLPDAVSAENLYVPESLDMTEYDFRASGSPLAWEDYEIGEKIDHVDGQTIEDAEHQMATRLYQNTARVHFNAHQMADNRFGKRLVYGGHVISIVRSLSYNGLANAFKVVAINGGRHVAPAFAGDTVYAWSEVLDKAEVAGHSDLGALRVRCVGVKNRDASGFPDKDADGKDDPSVILDLDIWVLVPRHV